MFLDTAKNSRIYIKSLIAILVHKRNFSHISTPAVRGEFVELNYSHDSVLLTSRCPFRC